jgi:ABC-2 type transport system ATP-binding protein
MNPTSILSCEGLCASYEGRDVFRSVRCAFTAGVYALQGANGIGKSTLLRLLAGAQPPDAGRVWIDGIDLIQDPEAAKRRLSYVPDESPIYPFMTGQELLQFVAVVKRTAIDASIHDLIGGFDLNDHLEMRFDAMSLGTRKKMMLCAAWIGAPRLLLLDEPINGLDPAARDQIVRLFRSTGKESAIVFSAHDKDLVSASGAAIVEMQSLLGAKHVLSPQ